MNLQIFDVDDLDFYDWETDAKGRATGKVVLCNNSLCSRGHLFSLYKNGVWQGFSLKEIAIAIKEKKNSG